MEENLLINNIKHLKTSVQSAVRMFFYMHKNTVYYLHIYSNNYTLFQNYFIKRLKLNQNKQIYKNKSVYLHVIYTE